MLISDVRDVGAPPKMVFRGGPLLPGSEMARGGGNIFGLGQQVPHRGGGAWRYSPECNDEIYGSCQPTELFGLGQQVPHRGGGAWRYSPECNEDFEGGGCKPIDLFGLGQEGQTSIPGGTGNLVATAIGAGLVGVSFLIQGDLKGLVRGLGLVLSGAGISRMINPPVPPPKEAIDAAKAGAAKAVEMVTKLPV